jgi:hypothetical protein
MKNLLKFLKLVRIEPTLLVGFFLPVFVGSFFLWILNISLKQGDTFFISLAIIINTLWLYVGVVYYIDIIKEFRLLWRKTFQS